MLKVKQIELNTERYGEGYECTVTFQVGEHIYNTVKVKLIPEATREIVDNIVEHAVEMLKVTTDSVPVAGEHVILPLINEAPAPEFAEVEEAAPPVLADAPEFNPEEAF